MLKQKYVKNKYKFYVSFRNTGEFSKISHSEIAATLA